jgi:cytochrome c553
MRIALSLLALVLAACGGSSSSGSGSSGSGGGGETGGGERAGESEGFDMEGFEETEPTIVHGSASARELIGVNPPPEPWAEMTHDEREYYMVAAILPIAAEDFRAHDAERYASLTCASCHGDDGREREYEMPSRYLPRLPAPGTPEWTSMTERPAYRFMSEVVTPTVRTQLGLAAYDPATGTGFGCFNCHPGGAAP